VLGSKKCDAVVFAQGANVNGSAMQTGTKEQNELFEANVTVIAESVWSPEVIHSGRALL
jgi:hypothetical protein